MSYLVGDDYPQAARPQAAAWDQRSRQPGWAGPPPRPGPEEDPGYYDPAYYQGSYGEQGYPEPGYYEPDYDDPAAYQQGYAGEAGQPDEYDQEPPYYQDSPEQQVPIDAGDGFAGQPEPDAYLDDIADVPVPGRPPRGRPYRRGRRNRRGRTRTKRVAGVVVAAASVVGVALLAPSILTAAQNETLTGVVTQSSLNGLNFAAAGRVVRVRVRLGQLVKKGQLLAREITPAGTLSALRTDRAAIVADRVDLAALTAAGAPPASVTAARAQLAADQAQQAADRAAMVIRAPMAGTVVAVFGRAGEAATPGGLPVPGRPPAATRLSATTLASLRGGGRELPMIALRTASSLQIRLSIPAESPAALRVGSVLTLSVPAARLTRVSGVVTTLSPSAGGSQAAVIQVRGAVPATALTGMQATVYLSS